MGGKVIRTIGQARASFAMMMMVACYNLKRLLYFQEAGIKGNTAEKSGDLPKKLNWVRLFCSRIN